MVRWALKIANEDRDLGATERPVSEASQEEGQPNEVRVFAQMQESPEVQYQ